MRLSPFQIVNLTAECPKSFASRRRDPRFSLSSHFPTNSRRQQRYRIYHRASYCARLLEKRVHLTYNSSRAPRRGGREHRASQRADTVEGERERKRAHITYRCVVVGQPAAASRQVCSKKRARADERVAPWSPRRDSTRIKQHNDVYSTHIAP